MTHVLRGARFSVGSDRALARRGEQGFTLVELIVAVLLVSVFATLAGPPFRDFIIRQRIRNAAYELMSDITFARSEAVKRNTAVTLSRAGTWSGGWTVADGATTLRQHPALLATITITAGNSSVDFLMNGRASSAIAFTIDDAGGSASIPARCVSVDPSGRPQSAEGSCP
jgi:type IV fimbrial biogenesis protein FimT